MLWKIGRADHQTFRTRTLITEDMVGKGGWCVPVQLPLPFPHLVSDDLLRSVDAALRRAIPAFNQDVRSVQVRGVASRACAPARLHAWASDLPEPG